MKEHITSQLTGGLRSVISVASRSEAQPHLLWYCSCCRREWSLSSSLLVHKPAVVCRTVGLQWH